MGMSLMVNQMQRWMRTALLGQGPAVAPIGAGVRWQPGVRPGSAVARTARAAVTPFKVPALAQRPAAPRRSYVRVDPVDRRRAVICGSPAQVCAVLEIMARAEAGR
ncbi:hypothetical protein [Rivibacter subsaxonicus]|uniref:Uncharacterized protein n=1 Tax=Rivibacter subsaxonicus TaxID=457575 RepID=A0A4Q7VAJ3_9BURK|nr:hypothetical protein [Rivibacter subsaxonicus]RZT93781.1 hypothetical protein EV670_3335 [Rivibacter subsaxonicus]